MPNNIPDLRVTLDGVDLTSKIRPRLMSLTISEKRGGEADQLELVIDDSDGKMALPKAGAVLHVQIGWLQGSEVTAGLVDKGSFKVDEVEHKGSPDQISIKGRSADFTSELRNRRAKSWHDITLGTVISEVARRNGLTPRVAPALASIALKSVIQSRESDMALMRRLGREHDAVATVKRGALIFSPVGAGQTTTGKAIPSLTLRRRDGDQHSYRIAKREESEGVTASYHDRRQARRHDVTVGKAGGARRLSRTYASEGHARTAAKSAHRRATRQPVTFDYNLALGQQGIAPERKVKLVGFKAEIDAVSWLVSEVTHTLSDRGYTQQVKLERAP
jgi:hypothetical protein